MLRFSWNFARSVEQSHGCMELRAIFEHVHKNETQLHINRNASTAAVNVALRNTDVE
jgi:hypothetical protein